MNLIYLVVRVFESLITSISVVIVLMFSGYSSADLGSNGVSDYNGIPEYHVSSPQDNLDELIQLLSVGNEESAKNLFLGSDSYEEAMRLLRDRNIDSTKAITVTCQEADQPDGRSIFVCFNRDVRAWGNAWGNESLSKSEGWVLSHFLVNNKKVTPENYFGTGRIFDHQFDPLSDMSFFSEAFEYFDEMFGVRLKPVNNRKVFIYNIQPSKGLDWNIYFKFSYSHPDGIGYKSNGWLISSVGRVNNNDQTYFSTTWSDDTAQVGIDSSLSMVAPIVSTHYDTESDRYENLPSFKRIACAWHEQQIESHYTFSFLLGGGENSNVSVDFSGNSSFRLGLIPEPGYTRNNVECQRLVKIDANQVSIEFENNSKKVFRYETKLYFHKGRPWYYINVFTGS